MAFRYNKLKQNQDIDLSEYDYDDSIFNNEDPKITELKRIISELPEPQRRVILIYAELASYHKVSDLLNVSQPTIANIVKDIRKHIYKAYGSNHF